jgi:regulator of sirC expression with transglutaminase-like and TPR domain
VADPFPTSPHFKRLLAGDPGADLTRIALEVAVDAYPTLDSAYYLDALDALAARAGERCPLRPRPHQLLQQINWVLYVEEEYKGDAENYYDPRNSYLNQVIERKAGIPISLAILYRAIAERLGLDLEGVNLPAHFVLRAQLGDETVFVDAYHQGAQLDRQGCRDRVHGVTGQWIDLDESLLGPCGTRAIVARMLRNLKAVYLREQDFESAWPVQRRLAALCPAEPLERRDLGLVALRTDRVGSAVEALETYLRDMPQADDAPAVTAYLRAARKDLAQRN